MAMLNLRGTWLKLKVNHICLCLRTQSIHQKIPFELQICSGTEIHTKNNLLDWHFMVFSQTLNNFCFANAVAEVTKNSFELLLNKIFYNFIIIIALFYIVLLYCIISNCI